MMELKDDRRFHNLTQHQVETLDQVLTEVIPIHGRGNFPTLKIKPKDIIHIVRDRLVSKNIKVRDVRLNGSTASHVLVKENGTSYKDLDIIFGVELSKQEDFQIIKEVVLGCLLDFLPQGVNKDKITALTMKEAYASTIQTPEQPEVLSEIVEHSVESQQHVHPFISQAGVLESYSQLDLVTPVETLEDLNLPDTKSLLPSPREIPSVTVVAESMYGDFEQAMDHLRYRLIATRNPEEIRGGGLLKYSNLLVRDFKPASETEIKTLERYMCSRFFIDFPDVNEQQRKIESYLRNHFIGEEKSKYDYLMTLRRVVNESTVCLMGHERRQTLNMITILALKVLGEQNIIPNTNNVTCYYQPAPYMTDHNFSNYYIANGQSQIIYHPYPLHIHMQTGLV
ncbi:hypothetical protein Q7C36_013687 [Tachysurus vachellii]|uniref:polynucleotide adenylyltransferase n=1 Tax=Tachysurus vachellii TaxID=175792 RepID=A0AA88MIY0_TACVA|nr:hypothetical protein Q7C36_013687 [Tachysurus vachellii]